jgi:predicted Zn finger-like uncharacterized protein
MILTCPECASRYFVDDDRVGPDGRAVRCASCGHKWTARAEDPLELGAAAQRPAPSVARSFADTPPPEPAVEAPPPTPAPLPQVFRERAETRKKVREAATAGAVWAGLAGGFVLLVGAAVLMRQDVASLWPRTAGAYAMAGLPVNLVGLTIENQHAQPQLQDGHAALVISGALRNIRDRPVVAPPLKVSLLNPAGRALAVKIADPDGARIPPGEARRFVINVLDPPVSATDVDIAFVLDHRTHKDGAPATTGPAPAKLSLRGAASPELSVDPIVPVAAGAIEAKPLPKSSPYALPRSSAGADPRG